MTLEELAGKFNSASVSIIKGPGEIPLVSIGNLSATAEISLLGAHVMSYTPLGGRDLLWMSPTAIFREGTGIRGGIPVCWPWFSRDVQDVQNPPSHGFVRTRLWELTDVIEPSPTMTTVVFTLHDTPETRAIWNHAFELELKVTVGAALLVELKSVNRDPVPVTISEAFHTYFTIGDISQITIEGFDGQRKFSKVSGQENVLQSGSITFTGEVDEVYENFTGTALISDNAMARDIVIEKQGSATSVVWNPWIEKSKTFKDFPPYGYKTMVCVECANARSNALTLKPGESATLSTCIYEK